MLTFVQFIAEDTHDVSGWMSPSGHPHIFDTNQEHEENHHPEYLMKAMKTAIPGYPNKRPDWRTIHHAQERGFVRFGKRNGGIHGNHYFIHYDERHPQGHKTALKALEYLHPHHDEPVAVSGEAGLTWAADELSKPMSARHAMRKLHQLANPVTEATHREYGFTEDFGFLRRNGTYAPAHSDEIEHYQIAHRLGYKGLSHAIHSGLIRHHSGESAASSHAYDYESHPASHKAVLRHLKDVSPTDIAYIDIRNSRKNNEPDSISGNVGEVRNKLRGLIH